MIRFVQTERAFAELSANDILRTGQHVHEQMKSGGIGIELGNIPFDPEIHRTGDIDYLSPITAATGELQARQVLPTRSLLVNSVVDYRGGRAYESVIQAKKQVQDRIRDALENALPGHGDRMIDYAIGSSDLSIVHKHTDLGFDLREREEAGSEEIAALSYRGLTLVIGSFNRLNFEGYRNLNNLVALKVNHPAERQIPAGVGFVSLGGAVEVDTNNPKQLDEVNRRLENRHMEIVDKLEEAGISVASVVLKPNAPDKIDTEETDRAIAEGVRSMAKKA